ncbi:helix-turn-helix domain-containing protein [Parasediminibacterium sp. JCM 36343]|uniref:helix-turn-helix domain-containing protein n=1 Tax=Parasediminibacterium sp. JCM 36343 TaxID=3374279 RepID=UPI00397C1983
MTTADKQGLIETIGKAITQLLTESVKTSQNSINECLNGLFEKQSEKELLTPSEACAFLHISKPTLYKLINRGLINRTKIEGCKRVYLKKGDILLILKDIRKYNR